jgi:hypothetical protein
MSHCAYGTEKELGSIYFTREAWPAEKRDDGRTFEREAISTFRALKDQDAIEAFIRRAEYLTKTLPEHYPELWAVKIYRQEIGFVTNEGYLERLPQGPIFEWKYDWPGSIQSYADTEIHKLNAIEKDQPYLESFMISPVSKYNPTYGDDRECVCGHTYYRHFDWSEDMCPTGCKYCGCFDFNEKEEEEEELCSEDKK